MIEKINRFIKTNELVRSKSTVVVGVSGGPDSLALLHYLQQFQREKNIRLIAAHVDHMFRGKESEEDLLFVKKFCATYRIRFESIQINVREYQDANQLGTQVAARERRYDYFREIMCKYKADYLALGHHGDDQIETILMRLVRGSKGIGYAGMQMKRPFACGEIIRPFLVVTKDEIEAYCKKYQLHPRRDPSNEKDDYTRNRFRHHVLPFLKKENPVVHEKFQQFSERLIEDEQLLNELTIINMNKVMKRKDGNEVEIGLGLFVSMPKSLQRRGIQLILKYLYMKIPPSLSTVHIDNLLALLFDEHPSGELHFPNGLRIVKSYDSCIFTYAEDKRISYLHHISEPGDYPLDNGGTITMKKSDSFPQEVHGNNFFVIDPTIIKWPLFVRTRKNGDKMTLKGMKGSKKVKDIFIDLKIPLQKRDTWPIVEDSNGEIIWLPGLKKSSFEAYNKNEATYFILQYKH